MRRPLTPAEWQGLDRGLIRALRDAGAQPMLAAHAHPAARLSRVWRGAVPILTLGDTIYWPDAPPELSSSRRPSDMAILQHELQHVLDYRDGRLTAARYLSDPREWSYEIEPTVDTRFDSLGAEQRATLAERLWLAEHGFRPASGVAVLRAVIPWAVQTGSPAVGVQGAA
jgi:hypothetical protein